jgi:Pyridoxamine 5'-phosphate oxidase
VAGVTMKVELDELAARLAEYTFAYLATVGDDGRVHLLAVLPEITGATLTIGGVGKHSLANVETHPNATLVWPPAAPDGFSLIVDGAASAGKGDGDSEIVVTPTKAILHRPAVDADGRRTGSDCAPVTLDSTS